MTLSPAKININPFPITLPSLALLKKTLFNHRQVWQLASRNNDGEWALGVLTA
jgi:hypothetical protein